MNTNTINLNKVIFVGLDVHKDSISLAAVQGYDKTLIAEKRFGTKCLKKLQKFLDKLSKNGPVHCCYEASGAGYALRRTIVGWGFHCDIAASTLIPKKPGERKKCDRLDARNIAGYYQSGLLTIIHVPTQEQEAARDLVRFRQALRKDVTCWKHRIVKFLATKGVVYHDGSNWTGQHRAWLEDVELIQKLDRLTLRHQLEALCATEARLDEIDVEIKALAETEPYRTPVSFLLGFKGVKTHTAMVLVTELADVRRFPDMQKLMDYTGLTPSVNQSGGSDNKAHSITKAGNSRLRHVLVQAAWNYAKSPRRSKELQRRQEGLPAWVIERSNKCQRRLYKRFHHLAGTRDRKKAVVGIARELAGFLGAVLTELAA